MADKASGFEADTGIAMELQYAPQSKNQNRVSIVLASGLVTTVAALVGVFLLQALAHINAMGLHIPLGAALVGVVASSGYGVASYRLGLRIRRTLLWTILLFQFLAYFGAEYCTFASRPPIVLPGTARPATFPEAFRFNATNMRLRFSGPGPDSEPLGDVGYFMVGLEILGFMLGGIFAPVMLSRHPYCDLCQLYLRRWNLGTIPAGIGGIFRAAARDPEAQTRAYRAADAKLRELARLVAVGDAASLKRELAMLDLPQRKAAALPARVTIELCQCPGCGDGFLQPVLHTGHGQDTKSRPLTKIPMTRQFISTVATTPLERPGPSPSTVAA